MKEKLMKIERYAFFGFLGLIGLSLLSILISGFIDSFRVFSLAFDYSFLSLFKGRGIKIVSVILAFITVLFFVVIWFINSRRMKRYSWGPIYLILFFIFFLFSNGYYNAIYNADFAFIILIITTIYLFINTTFSLITYLITLKYEEVDL